MNCLWNSQLKKKKKVFEKIHRNPFCPRNSGLVTLDNPQSWLKQVSFKLLKYCQYKLHIGILKFSRTTSILLLEKSFFLWIFLVIFQCTVHRELNSVHFHTVLRLNLISENLCKYCKSKLICMARHHHTR